MKVRVRGDYEADFIYHGTVEENTDVKIVIRSGWIQMTFFHSRCEVLT